MAIETETRIWVSAGMSIFMLLLVAAMALLVFGPMQSVVAVPLMCFFVMYAKHYMMDACKHYLES